MRHTSDERFHPEQLVDGRVEADGTHDELVQQDGRYAELFDLQAAGYR